MPRIIVGVDESDRSKDAIALASRLARRSAAELVLVNAFPYDDVPGRAANPAYRESLREESLRALQRLADACPQLGPTSLRPVAGTSPARAIQEAAAEAHATLIVIGSSHRGAVGRVLAGTTAQRLLHGSPCPVAVAPKGFRALQGQELATIGVGYDGSEEAAAALAAATAMARAMDARLRIIEVLDAVWAATPSMLGGSGFIVPPKEIEADARMRLAALVDELPAGVAGEAVLRVGDPEAELAGQAGTVDLMVVGSRGYGPHQAVLLGSVSGRLVRDAGCPVLVVPRGVGAPLEELFPAASGPHAA